MNIHTVALQNVMPHRGGYVHSKTYSASIFMAQHMFLRRIINRPDYSVQHVCAHTPTLSENPTPLTCQILRIKLITNFTVCIKRNYVPWYVGPDYSVQHVCAHTPALSGGPHSANLPNFANKINYKFYSLYKVKLYAMICRISRMADAWFIS